MTNNPLLHCREAFETWAKNRFILRRNDETNGKYSWSDTENAWIGWQAAWNTRAAADAVEAATTAKQDDIAERLAGALKEILNNDGGQGSKCYSALRLYDAREIAKEALAEFEARKGGG